MTKRVAANQITHENWNDKEETEDAGQFVKAEDGKLKDRVIKRAKRRIQEDKNGVPSTPFAKFAGFVSTKSPNSANFNFVPNKLPTSNGNTLSSLPKSISPSQPSNSNEFLKPKTLPSLSMDSSSSEGGERQVKGNSDYLEKLKLLNVTFISWVRNHMEKNSFCDFTPVCKDYIKHVQGLDKASPASGASILSLEDGKQNPRFSFQQSTEVSRTPDKTYSDSSPQSSQIENANLKSSLFASQAASFSFKRNSDSPNTAGSGFSFFSNKSNANDSSAPFSFASRVASTKTESSTNAKPNEEENYVPPKNEFDAVKESDALYSKRCKLFFKKDGNYVEKGVGTLFLKTIDGKTQLLVRADTSLGNVLLNILLNDNLPIERVGKNNVLVVCVPNPPLDPKNTPVPTPMLFRVKTTEDADELVEKLNKFKSGYSC